MGQVRVPAKVENLFDLMLAGRGDLPPEGVHRIEVSDALVDTGSTTVGMPKRYLEQLGLTKPLGFRETTTAEGARQVPYYGPVKLSVQDRYCFAEVAELAEECPILIGFIPLETMDFIVDPRAEKLIGRHDGRWVSYLL